MGDQDGMEWPARASLSARLIGGVYRCRNHFWDRDAEIAGAHNLTWTQFVVLAVLRGESDGHAMSPKDIGRFAQVTTGGLSKILTLLEERGLVTRASSRSDGRSRLVKLSPKGKALAENVFSKVCEQNEIVLHAALSDAECEDLARLIRKLSDHLDSQV